MRGRVGLFIGLGAGYVLGAKAGHERYTQLTRLYANILESPKVKEATDKAKQTVGSGLETAKDKAGSGLETAKDKANLSAVKMRHRTSDGGDLSVAPPPTV